MCHYSTFKYWCSARVKKIEQNSLKYALISEVIRDGGLKMAVLVRYSSLPGHRGLLAPLHRSSRLTRTV